VLYIDLYRSVLVTNSGSRIRFCELRDFNTIDCGFDLLKYHFVLW
jgi:hypothetical protein